jgi:hypothetical protein
VSQSSPTTPLANSQINHDQLSVESVEPDGVPAMVRIVWPRQPTVVPTVRFPETAAAIARLGIPRQGPEVQPRLSACVARGNATANSRRRNLLTAAQDPRGPTTGPPRSCAASPWSARLGDDTGLAVKQPTSTARTSDAGLAPVPSHTDALMGPTLAACAAVDVSRVGAVLQVIAAGLPSGRLPALSPSPVSFGKSLDLVGCEAQVADCGLELVCLRRGFQ